VDALAEEERGARVPEVMEADVGETSPLEERREAALSEVGGVDRGSGLCGDEETLIVVEVLE
jgi:hypothetical protein